MPGRGTAKALPRGVRPLRPLQQWLAKYERAINERFDRMDDYLTQLQQGDQP